MPVLRCRWTHRNANEIDPSRRDHRLQNITYGLLAAATCWWTKGLVSAAVSTATAAPRLVAPASRLTNKKNLVELASSPGVEDPAAKAAEQLHADSVDVAVLSVATTQIRRPPTLRSAGGHDYHPQPSWACLRPSTWCRSSVLGAWTAAESVSTPERCRRVAPTSHAHHPRTCCGVADRMSSHRYREWLRARE